MDPKVTRLLSYGVYVVSAYDKANGRNTGCVANCVMQITSTPKTVAVSMNHDNYTHRCIAESGLFMVSILGEHTDPTIIGSFGFTSGKDRAKFDGVATVMAGEGDAKLPAIADSCGYLLCRVFSSAETSTHTVFFAEVIDADKLKSDAPMSYAYYQNVINGKSPKNAPTHIEEAAPEAQEPKASEKHYVCDICGYVYDGDIPFEDLPDTWVCPLCGVGKDLFTLM